MIVPKSELRNTPSVEEGITLSESTNRTQTIIYAPGNGSRYAIRLDELSYGQRMRYELGISDGAVLVTDILNRTAHIFQPTGFLSCSYVAEKLRRNLIDGLILAELIAYFIPGREAASASALSSEAQVALEAHGLRTTPLRKNFFPADPVR